MFRKKKIFFILFLTIGFIWRLWLASFAYNDPRFDFATYESLSKDFLDGRLAIDCCTKNSGYSVFLAFIYAIFGFRNYLAVKVAQVLLDLVSGLLLYHSAKAAFSELSGKLTFIIYMINPFTSSYTGIILPEIVSIFYLSILTFLLTRKTFVSNYRLWLIFGMIFGILVFTRTQFFHPMLVVLPVLTRFCIEKGKKILFIFVSCAAFVVASGYSLYGYYSEYHVVSVLPPITLSSVSYGIFTRTGPFPEVPQEYEKDDPVLESMFVEFFSSPIELRKDIQKKYQLLFFEKLLTDWPVFVKKYLLSIYWIWDKRHLFYYIDPFYEVDHIPVKIGNILLLLSAVYGLIRFSIEKKISDAGKNLFIFSVILFITATFIYPLVSYESRHTISLYGLVILWASYGMIISLERLVTALKKNIL